jgi:hypothetical protein
MTEEYKNIKEKVEELLILLEEAGADSENCIENNSDGTPSGYCDDEVCRLHYTCIKFIKYN